MTSSGSISALLAGMRRLASMALSEDGDVQAVLDELLREADADSAAVLRIQAAAALEARAARAAARLDALTGILNHGAMRDALREEISRAARHGTPLSCLMVDLDHFKAINDLHGHAVGDAVLRAVAGVLVAGSRPYDRVCRYGGDEFVVLLPEVALPEAAIAAERIRADVAAAVETFPGVGLRLAASVGVAQWQPGEAAVQLLAAADGALLEAKRGGRDGINGARRRPPGD